MMNRILVPLDGSPRAEQALAVAARLARATNGTLILVQAVSWPIEYANPFAPQIAPSSIEQGQRDAQEYLTCQAGLPMLSGLTVETDVRTETPALALLTAAGEHRADLIVMTSHGRTGLAHWVLGSVAEHIARQATIPVLMLREHELPFWCEGKDFTEMPQDPQAPGQAHTYPKLRVLIPLDGSPLAETAVDPAAACAVALVRGMEQAMHAPTGSIACLLHLVVVVRPYEVLIENMPEALVVTGAEGYLKRIAIRLHETYPGVAITWEVTTGADVAQVLSTLAEGKQRPEKTEKTEEHSAPDAGAYTLLAMATHGRTGVMHWVWGSITERVVQKTRLPILLIRPPISAATRS